MKEADILNKKDSTILKMPMSKFDENKLKQLEARFIGPSSDGNLPVDFQPLMDFDLEQIKTSN